MHHLRKWFINCYAITTNVIILWQTTMGEKKRNIKIWCPHGLLWRSWSLWTSFILYLKPTKHCHEKGTCWIIPPWWSWYYEKNVTTEIEQKRRKIIKIFKDCGLSITIKTDLTSVDFLDIRLNLKDNTYEPYRKPNSEPIYIHKSSNHPKNIIKNLPKAIEKRYSDTSCNQEVFEATLPIYEEALRKSGFNKKLIYTKNNINNLQKKEEKRRRKHNIIWFNSPFSANVKTNIGKVFFRTLKKNFPRNRLFYKVFNKNTIK